MSKNQDLQFIIQVVRTNNLKHNMDPTVSILYMTLLYYYYRTKQIAFYMLSKATKHTIISEYKATQVLV
jgi:hypothetical protein